MKEPDTPLVNNVVILYKQACHLCPGHNFGMFIDFQCLYIVNRVHRQVLFRDTKQKVRDRYLSSYDGFQLIVKFEGQFKRGYIMEIIGEDTSVCINDLARIFQLILFHLCISKGHFDTLFLIELINQEFLFRDTLLL